MLELVTICALWTANWPQFRGPNADGHVVQVVAPLEWSDTKNVAWKVNIDGLGWSSPVVVANRVYVTTAVAKGEGLSLRAIAIDADSGEVIWDREVRSVEQSPQIHTKNSHASPTPIVHDGAVYVHFGTLGMARLKAGDGAIQWLCTELQYPPQHGSGGSPLLCDGRLFVVCDGSSNPYVAAVDAATGRVAWKTLRAINAKISHSFVTPTVAHVNGKSQLLAPGPGHFAAYDTESGEEIWRVVAAGWSVVPQPAIGHGMVFYNHDYDNPELMAVRLDGQGDVTDTHVAWRLKRGAPSTPSPLLVGDELYFVADNGVATCVDAKTGKVHWTQRLGGKFSASPIFANGRVLFLNEDGLATWVRAGRDFEVLGKNELTGRTLATPAFAVNAMFLRTDECLYKIAE
ncbi:MAG: PQQ-binding-like beta-propeller repeat protein [Pirellulaceae bacterium]|nr:PQQ-binding-like beta-propeller repeat protein [Planctomycetales bacterium]